MWDSHNVVFHVSHVPLPKYFFEKFKNLWDIWDTWDSHNVTIRASRQGFRRFWPDARPPRSARPLEDVPLEGGVEPEP